MRREYRFFIFGLFFFISLVHNSLYGISKLDNKPMPLRDSRGAPSEALIDFFEFCSTNSPKTWESILKIAKEWFVSIEDKKNGIWPSPCLKRSTHELYNILSALHSTQVIPSYYATYDYAVILGGTLTSMRSRLFFLKQEWDRGVRFKEIVFVTSDRVRSEALEDQTLLLEPNFVGYIVSPAWSFEGFLPKNEKEIAEFVWSQMERPEEWESEKMKVSFIEAKSKEGGKFSSRKDSLQAWLSMNPNPGKVLFVSSQPYIGLDNLVICREFYYTKFIFDTVGPGFSMSFLNTERGLGVCCEAIANWVYNFKK